MNPILFNSEMVCAILDGRKTATRRAVKPQPISKLAYVCMGYKHGTWVYPDKDTWKYWDDESFRLPDGLPEPEGKKRWTPPCHTGDILYVRETWRLVDFDYIDGDWSANVSYKADCGIGPRLHYLPHGSDERCGWRPSIHMPREAARLFLRVTDVRVERLQDITTEQAMAEGVIDPNPARRPYIRYEEVGQIEWCARNRVFPEVWDSTIKPADRALYGWEANPWCWAIEFERCEKPEEDT